MGRKPFANYMRKRLPGFAKSSEASPYHDLSPLDRYPDHLASSLAIPGVS
jgi:hypothetical protein